MAFIVGVFVDNSKIFRKLCSFKIFTNVLVI